MEFTDVREMKVHFYEPVSDDSGGATWMLTAAFWSVLEALDWRDLRKKRDKNLKCMVIDTRTHQQID